MTVLYKMKQIESDVICNQGKLVVYFLIMLFILARLFIGEFAHYIE